MNKERVLRIHAMRAVFENKETGSCLLASQIEDSMGSLRELRVCHRSELPDLGQPEKTLRIEAIFGIYDLFSCVYVALVVESEPALNTPALSARKATKIIVLPLFSVRKKLSEVKQYEEDQYLSLLRKGFEIHDLYFSLNSDITCTQQRIAKLSSQQANDPFCKRADHRFFWNWIVIFDLIARGAFEWVHPFMSAFIEYKPDCECGDKRFDMLVISRRSRYRQGCRFTRRGIDNDGYVSNFVETEQILIFPDGQVTSYVQVRGSIPLLWASPVNMKYTPPVLLEDGLLEESTNECNNDNNDSSTVSSNGLNRNNNVKGIIPRSIELCRKHIADDLCTNYSDKTGASGCILINLIDSKSGSDQSRLGEAFGDAIDTVRNKIMHPVRYVWYDFHKETKKKGKWNNLASLLLLLYQDFRAQSYFCRLGNGHILSYQVGVVRTNCMDNLDRTNVVQSLFARRSLLMQIGADHIGPTHPLYSAIAYLDSSTFNNSNTNSTSNDIINDANDNIDYDNDNNNGRSRSHKGAVTWRKPASLPSLTPEQQKELLTTPWRSFETEFKSIWVNNANCMSLLYAGSGALKVDFTKTGKRTINGMYDDAINSCQRYYINNFTDAAKQDAIDLMLGNYTPDESLPSPFTFNDNQETLMYVCNKLITFAVLIFLTLLCVLSAGHSSYVSIIFIYIYYFLQFVKGFIMYFVKFIQMLYPIVIGIVQKLPYYDILSLQIEEIISIITHKIAYVYEYSQLVIIFDTFQGKIIENIGTSSNSSVYQTTYIYCLKCLGIFLSYLWSFLSYFILTFISIDAKSETKGNSNSNSIHIEKTGHEALNNVEVLDTSTTKADISGVTNNLMCLGPSHDGSDVVCRDTSVDIDKPYQINHNEGLFETSNIDLSSNSDVTNATTTTAATTTTTSSNWILNSISFIFDFTTSSSDVESAHILQDETNMSDLEKSDLEERIPSEECVLSRNDLLLRCLLASAIISCLMASLSMMFVMKFGSRIGEKVVIRPCLLRENYSDLISK